MTKNWARAAGWWASDYAYAVQRQMSGLFTRIDPSTTLVGERPPVVVIPGIYESWRFLAPLISHVHRLGHPIHVVDSLKFNVRTVSDSAALVSNYVDQHKLSGAVILAHSKGGLIGKHVMIRPESHDAIKGMLAVATPFSGSHYARLMFAPSLRIFSPMDATIRALAIEHEVNSRIVSIYAAFDPHIPGGSELAGAKNVLLDTGGHFRILRHPRILTELDELAQRDMPPHIKSG